MNEQEFLRIVEKASRDLKKLLLEAQIDLIGDGDEKGDYQHFLNTSNAKIPRFKISATITLTPAGPQVVMTTGIGWGVRQKFDTQPELVIEEPGFLAEATAS